MQLKKVVQNEKVVQFEKVVQMEKVVQLEKVMRSTTKNGIKTVVEDVNVNVLNYMLYFVFLGEAERAARAAFGELRGAAKGALDFALGGGSRTAAAFIFCPITVLKTRA